MAKTQGSCEKAERRAGREEETDMSVNCVIVRLVQLDPFGEETY